MTPRPIPASVRALLPLCGSKNDHEALGACRGVGRKLQAAGLDWHALAAAIPAADRSAGRTFVSAPTQSGARQDGLSRRRDHSTGTPRPRPFDTYSWRHTYTPAQESEHRSRVRFCQSRPWCFSARERTFLSDIAKLHGNLSIKQGDWLAVLADRLDQELRTA